MHTCVRFGISGQKLKKFLHYGKPVDAETAVREEYCTLGWIMEGLIERAGFHIDKKEYFEGLGSI
jgi:hypothetical protein